MNLKIEEIKVLILFSLSVHLIGIFFEWWNFSELILATSIILYILLNAITQVGMALAGGMDDYGKILRNDLNNIVYKVDEINEKIEDIKNDLTRLNRRVDFR